MAENNHVPASNMMEPALQEIGLGCVAGKLKEEKIDIGAVMSTTDEDLIKLGIRIRLRGICRRCYDTINNKTHGCGSYSYTTTTRPNTNSFMQTLKGEERSFLFSPRSSGDNGHRSSSSRRASSSTTTRKNAEKERPGAGTWTGQFMCRSDRISDKIQNPRQKQVLQKAGLGLKKIVFDLEDTEEEVYVKLTSSELDEDQNRNLDEDLAELDENQRLSWV